MTRTISSGMDVVKTGEVGMIFRPRIQPRVPKPCVILVLGSGLGGVAWIDDERLRYVVQLADAGYTIICSDINGGPDNWGNSNEMAVMDAHYAFSQTLPDIAHGPVVLMGQSRSAMNGLVWARYNRAKVLCVIGVIPVTNLTDIYGRGYGSFIDAAYGGYSEEVYGLQHNPATMAANGSFTNLPFQIWQGDTDTTCPPSITSAVVANMTGAEYHLISGGHADSTTLAVDIPTVVSFIQAAASVIPVIPTPDPGSPPPGIVTYRFLRLFITKAITAGSPRPPNSGAIRVADMRFKAAGTYYPTVAMTGPTSPSPLVALASTDLGSGFEAYHAFDGDLSDSSRWASTASATSTQWLQIDFGAGNGIAPTSVDIAMDLAADQYYLADFQIIGSNTGAFTGEQVTLLSVTGANGWAPSTYRTFDIPPATLLPMDTYFSNMYFAYGLKQVLGSYVGPLIRVRRSNDDAEQDIGFISDGTLDTTALATFVGSNSAYVVKWYDQLYVVNAIQTTQSLQPMIVNAGTYLGYIKMDGVDDYFVTHTPAVTALSFAAFVQLTAPPTASGTSASYVTHPALGTAGVNALTWQYQQTDNRTNLYAFTGSSSYSNVAAGFSTGTTSSVAVFDRTAYPPRYYTDGADRGAQTNSGGSPDSNPFTDQAMYIGSDGAAQSGATQWKELICWTVNQNANFFGIFGAL